VIDYAVIKTSAAGKKINATGFVIREHTDEELTQAIVLADQAYLDKPTWLKLQRNAVGQDFSWKRSAITLIYISRPHNSTGNHGMPVNSVYRI